MLDDLCYIQLNINFLNNMIVLRFFKVIMFSTCVITIILFLRCKNKLIFDIILTYILYNFIGLNKTYIDKS